MKNTIRLNEEISKGVKVRKNVTTKIEYFCESASDREKLCNNLREVLVKHLEGSNLAKITYDLNVADNVVEVEIQEHIGK